MNPTTDSNDRRVFTARAFPVHLYSGQDALGWLPKELARFDAQRAVIMCGRSVHEKTPLIAQISEIVGPRFAGVFAGISEGAPAECIERAADFAQRVDADALIAVGAGSVLKGVRVVAMLMGERRTLTEMATRYDAAGKPIATKLLKPKCPIFNVPTAPSTAQNRGGSALRVGGDLHQLEFFDPKTRPRAIFWDPAALATAPSSLMAATGLEVYFLALMGMGSAPTANVLVAPSRAQAWKLARDSMARLAVSTDMNARLDLCAAAYLQNRDEDDGGQPLKPHLMARAAYALSVAVFNRCTGITQSHGYAAFSGLAIRRFGSLCIDAVREIGMALGVSNQQGSEGELIDRVARATEDAFAKLGWSVRLSKHTIDAVGGEELAKFALRNYNANSDGALTPHKQRLLGMVLDVVGDPPGSR